MFDYKNFFDELIIEILDTPTQSGLKLDVYEQSNHYYTDSIYRVIVDTGRALFYELEDNSQAAIELCEKNIETANNIGVYYVAIYNYNTLGNLYNAFGMYEKSIAIFLLMIQLENTYGYCEMTVNAYSNLGMIYRSLEDVQSYTYYMQAFTFAKDNKNSISRHTDKMIHIIASLVIVATQHKMPNEAKRFMHELELYEAMKMNDFSKAIILESKMFYTALTGQFDLAKQYFVETYTLYDAIHNINDLLVTMISFAKISLANELDISFSVPYLHELLDRQYTMYPNYYIEIIYILICYYQNLGDVKQLSTLYCLYLYYSEEENKLTKKNHILTLELIENSVRIKEENDEIIVQNTQLKEYTDALIKNREEIEEFKILLDLTMVIGEQVNLTLNAREVVENIYHQLKQHFPITAFCFLFFDKESHMLTSMVNYENDQIQPKISVNCDDQNSQIAMCFHQQKLIVINDISRDISDITKPKYTSNQSIGSALFIPIAYQSEAQGVCTIQAEQTHVFGNWELKLIELVRPYLAIAFRNAKYSEELEATIIAHKKTQEKLKVINSELEDLSSRDGLTGVGNRRIFNIRYQEFLRLAQRYSKSIAIYMIDIDYFKWYNDSYGHLKGDEVLISVASELDAIFSSDEFIFARYGGEEFIAVVIGEDYQHSKLIGEQIRTSIEALKIEHTVTIPGIVTVSIGMVFKTDVHENMATSYIELADKALYMAKNRGRNRVEISK